MEAGPEGCNLGWRGVTWDRAGLEGNKGVLHGLDLLFAPTGGRSQGTLKVLATNE